MRYVKARFHDHEELMAYRIYISDCMKAVVDNIESFGGHGITMRYFEVINNPDEKEERTADEIKEDLKSKMSKLIGE